MPHRANLTFLVAVLVASAATATFPACGGQTIGTVGSGGSASTTTSGANPFACTGSQPELVLGQPSGYEQCANGMVHRPSVVTCPSGLPRTTTCSQGSSDKCGEDSDCTGGPHDFCGRLLLPPLTNYCGCSHGCLSDAECSPGSICVCGDPVGTCVSATCKSDADCAPGLVCAEYTPGTPGLRGLVRLRLPDARGYLRRRRGVPERRWYLHVRRDEADLLPDGVHDLSGAGDAGELRQAGSCFDRSCGSP